MTQGYPHDRRPAFGAQAVEKTSGAITSQQKALTNLLQPEAAARKGETGDTAGAAPPRAPPSPKLSRALSSLGDQSKQVFEQTKQARRFHQ